MRGEPGEEVGNVQATRRRGRVQRADRGEVAGEGADVEAAEVVFAHGRRGIEHQAGDGFAEVEAALDFGACRELIRESEVRMTLYQSVVDLGTGDLAFRLRRARSGDVWTEVEGWNFHRLLRAGAASGTEPVTTGAGC